MKSKYLQQMYASVCMLCMICMILTLELMILTLGLLWSKIMLPARSVRTNSFQIWTLNSSELVLLMLESSNVVPLIDDQTWGCNHARAHDLLNFLLCYCLYDTWCIHMLLVYFSLPLECFYWFSHFNVPSLVFECNFIVLFPSCSRATFCPPVYWSSSSM